MNVNDKAGIKAFLDLYSKDNNDPFPHTGNWHNVDRNKANLGYGWIHYSLIRNGRPEKILVIGSRYGFIPAVCALACRDNNKGKVFFVDAGYDYRYESDKAWGGVGFWQKTDVKKHFRHFGLNPYLKFHLMTSQDFFQRNRRERWDYIYIDGDHSYLGVKSDFNNFWPKLNKGGFLMLHDIYPVRKDGSSYGVNRLWQEIKNKKRYSMLEFPGELGLGLIQK